MTVNTRNQFAVSDRSRVVADCAEECPPRLPEFHREGKAGENVYDQHYATTVGCHGKDISNDTTTESLWNSQQRDMLNLVRSPAGGSACGAYVCPRAHSRATSNVLLTSASAGQSHADVTRPKDNVSHHCDSRRSCAVDPEVAVLEHDLSILDIKSESGSPNPGLPQDDNHHYPSESYSYGEEVLSASSPTDPDSLEVFPADCHISIPELGACEPEKLKEPCPAFNVTFPKLTEPVLYSEMEAYPTLVYGANADGDNLLHLAVIHGKVDAVHRILHLTPCYRWLDRPNLLLQTPLHLAVLTRQPRVVRMLVVRGATVDARDRHGNTALHLACQLGDLESVVALTRPVHYTEIGQSLYTIPMRRIPQEADLLNYAGDSCLHLAAAHCNLPVVRYLLEDAGFDVNVREYRAGKTILHMAVENLDIPLLESLVLSRWDINLDLSVRTYSGLTPRKMAELAGHVHLARSLEAFGAELGTYVSDSCNESSDCFEMVQ